MSEDKTVNECWGYNQETRDRVERIEDRISAEFKEIRNELKEVAERLTHRLPTWAVFYISLLTLLVGALMAKVAFR